jgi:hypothetical protein
MISFSVCWLFCLPVVFLNKNERIYLSHLCSYEKFAASVLKQNGFELAAQKEALQKL